MTNQAGKLRVGSGTHRNRVFKTMAGLNTRPTRAIVRESLFNSIGAAIDEARTLDLFGGSGALTWEALSRGARFGTIVEKNPSAARLIGDNASALQFSTRCQILTGDAQKSIARLVRNQTPPPPYDLVFADPPYESWDRAPLCREILTIFLRLSESGLLAESATIYCESEHSNWVDIVEEFGLRLMTQKKIGRTQITALQRS